MKSLLTTFLIALLAWAYITLCAGCVALPHTDAALGAHHILLLNGVVKLDRPEACGITGNTLTPCKE